MRFSRRAPEYGLPGVRCPARGLPVGAAYAVWVGIGAVLTVAYAAVTGQDPLSARKAVFRLMVVVGIVGLTIAH